MKTHDKKFTLGFCYFIVHRCCIWVVFFSFVFIRFAQSFPIRNDEEKRRWNGKVNTHFCKIVCCCSHMNMQNHNVHWREVGKRKIKKNPKYELHTCTHAHTHIRIHSAESSLMKNNNKNNNNRKNIYRICDRRQQKIVSELKSYKTYMHEILENLEWEQSPIEQQQIIVRAFQREIYVIFGLKVWILVKWSKLAFGKKKVLISHSKSSKWFETRSRNSTHLHTVHFSPIIFVRLLVKASQTLAWNALEIRICISI